ncbi:MAG: hypothetical protein HY401_05265 [Elusimicrobia bacterium]|nr:hypothetical protein [Elusimicrobiota bacterium]
MPFGYNAPEEQYAFSAKGFADSVTGALLKTGRLRLVERSRLDALLNEAKLAQTGLIDSATAAKLGRQLGAQAIILGSLTSVSVHDEKQSLGFAWVKTRRVEITVEARLVAIETGEILASAQTTGQAKAKHKSAFGAKTGAIVEAEILIPKALQDAADRLAHDLAKGAKPLK